MRLGDFIRRDMDAILARWDAFAATRTPAARSMQSRALRDHGREILEAIIADLATAQTADEQVSKSKGLAVTAPDAPETAAQTHAVLRANVGFTIEQLVSEYRALRSSVLIAWTTACLPDPPDLDDMVRFNEAIDQAVAESVSFFSAHVTRARNLLLGMLSHDLRSPLQTIQMTARYLHSLYSEGDVGHAAERLIRSGTRMQALLDDLVDFNRSELGVGIKVSPDEVDLAKICAEELEQIGAAHAGRTLELSVEGNCRGYWDARRIQQLLNNLVINAIRYGDTRGKVRVEVAGAEAEVRLSVINTGKAIDDETMAWMFEPLRRGLKAKARDTDGLGLGLYITNEIAKAHGGTIQVSSDDTRTAFTVSLPRHAPAPAG